MDRRAQILTNAQSHNTLTLVMWGIHIGCEIILHYISVVSILRRITYLKLKWIVIVVSLKLRKEYEDTLSPRVEACWKMLFSVYTRYQTTIPDDWCIFKASFTFFKDSDILKLVFSQFVYTSENISLVSLSMCVCLAYVFSLVYLCECECEFSLGRLLSWEILLPILFLPLCPSLLCSSLSLAMRPKSG